MVRAIVKREENIRVVKAIAAAAMRLRVLLALKVLHERLRIHFLLDTCIMPSPPCHDSSVFNADNAVGQLGNFFIVGNHDDGLAELLAGYF